MKHKHLSIFINLGILFVLLVTACAPKAAITPEATAPPVEATKSPSPTETQPPEPTDTPLPTEPPPTETPELGPEPSDLPPDPILIEFQAEDGQPLYGTFYPAAVKDAPVVVFMHWVAGNEHDWDAIAPWLQNRQGEMQASMGVFSLLEPRPLGAPWLDDRWFPAVSETLMSPVNVFTATYRSCEGVDGCQKWLPKEWVLDSLAMVNAASQLPYVDSHSIVTDGASIGATGAVTGAAQHNMESQATVVGAMSMSPGPYFDRDYTTDAKYLDDQGVLVWCLYAADDPESAPTCKSLTGEHFQTFEYAGRSHGMLLIVPEIEPNTLQLLLDFLHMLFD
ncbi:MAG: hypothetical protein AB1345_05010 [Chloroflexota bacterium]